MAFLPVFNDYPITRLRFHELKYVVLKRFDTIMIIHRNKNNITTRYMVSVYDSNVEMSVREQRVPREKTVDDDTKSKTPSSLSRRPTTDRS